MNQSHIYELDPEKRLLHSLLPIKKIGWMPHHKCFHQNSIISDLFVCISSNQESYIEVMNDGMLSQFLPSPLPRFVVVLPGTLKNTIRASYHDELFFHYPAECLSLFRELFGEELLQKDGFYFTGIPETVIAELRRELEHFNEPGVPDLLDQLAIQLITRILIQHRAEQQGENTLRLKLHSIVAELDQGETLTSVLKRYSISERTFYREWRKVFSVSPKEYLMQYRLKNACALLAETNMAISEISEKSGFTSNVYFHQLFREKIGMSPGQFRRKKHNLLSSQ